jgi:hypothetical protein
MTYRPNPDNQGWVTCRERLFETLVKWQRGSMGGRTAIDCPMSPRYTAHSDNKADRAVSVTFSAGRHIDRTVTVDRFERPVDNLWALALGLEAIRLNELRGLDDVARQVYMALPAPKVRDPWEVLGLRPGADSEMITAAYRVKARAAHPDAGGSGEAMAELNDARDRALAEGVK